VHHTDQTGSPPAQAGYRSRRRCRHPAARSCRSSRCKACRSACWAARWARSTRSWSRRSTARYRSAGRLCW